MNSAAETYRTFHQHVQAAYSSVYAWLDSEGATRYKTIEWEGITRSLYGTTLQDCANVYHGIFHAHYFKVLHTLEAVVGFDRLLGWLRHNPYICVVDIGCGAGAGSAAFIGSILRLLDEGLLTHPIEVLCVGVDPNICALGLYNRLLSDLQTRVLAEGITLSHRVHAEPIPGAILPVIQTLRKVREDRAQPFLPHVLAMQVNIVSPLSNDHVQRAALRDELHSLGVGVDAFLDQQVDFGEPEALAYRQFFEQIPIDNIHLLTVATDNDPCPQRLQEMGIALKKTFSGGRHRVDEFGEGSQLVCYANPSGSFWRRKGYRRAPPVTFFVHAASITSESLSDDSQWQALIADDNLRLAWARARHHILAESIADEVEIRVFDRNLEQNLVRLKEQLLAYAQEIIPSDQRLSYSFPKKSGVRPRGLSAVGEAILSAAILQQLGSRADRLKGESYAYSLSKRRPSEYLYESWFSAYQRYLFKARKVALECEGCAIIQVDIRSFFERIVQRQLLELASKELRTASPRIEWLLRLLLSKEIDAHEEGRGLVQGNIDSGFYANIYLSDVDMRFASGNEWNVTFLRYVDDMVFIVPNPNAIADVIDALRHELNQLGLELNEEKTETYDDASSFVEAITDHLLEELSAESDAVFNPLWIMDDTCREVFLRASSQSDSLWWWYGLGVYQKCLRELGVYADLPRLSRKIDRYLRNVSLRKRDIKRVAELSLPTLPRREDLETLSNWATQFEQYNAEWLSDKERLLDKVEKLVQDSWSQLQLPDASPNGQRTLLRRLHFGVNKLIQLGSGIAGPLLAEILCKSAWLVRSPSAVAEGLAVQGRSSDVDTVLAYHAESGSPTSEFVRVVTLRALRFLPTITTSQWQNIVRYSTSGSSVERLLATETWLYLGDTCRDLVTDEDVSALKNAASASPSQGSRLRKNYVLLLGRYDASALAPIGSEDDEILRDVYELSAEGSLDLFDEPEPDLIRRSYYSGRDPDDGQGGPSL